MEALRELVESFIADLKSKNAQPIGAPFVAASVAAMLPHAPLFTLPERQAVYIGIGSVAREILRNMGTKEYDATRIGQESFDLPEAALLNEGYSVMRADEPVYVPRVLMTRDDMEFVCRKFDGLSAHFGRASRALRADFERRNSLAS